MRVGIADIELPNVAANDWSWNSKGVKKWLFRIIKITGIIAVAVAAFEMSDMAA